MIVHSGSYVEPDDADDVDDDGDHDDSKITQTWREKNVRS